MSIVFGSSASHEAKPVPTDVPNALKIPANSADFWIPADADLKKAWEAHDARPEGDKDYLGHAARLLGLAQLPPEQLDALIKRLRTEANVTEHKPTIAGLFEKLQTLQRAKAIAALLQGGAV